MFRITIAVDDFTDEQINHLKDVFASCARVDRIPQSSNQKTYRDVLKVSDVFVGWPDPSLVKGSAIRLLQIGSSGWETYQRKEILQLGIKLCTAKGIYSIGVAEHCIAMMMALVRKLPLHIKDKENRLFKRRSSAGEVTGATACIVGMGDIGTTLAKRCKGLEMHVSAVVRRRHELDYPYVDRVFRVEDISEAFSQADHIFLTLSAGHENHRLIDKRILKSIQPHAFLYNVSRGSVIDEQSLFELLKNKQMAGAGIDVTEKEPLALDSLLWELGDQVLITGHSAGISDHFVDRFYNLVIRNCMSFIENKPLENRVL